MKIERVKKLPVRERFFYWVWERQQIYLRRQAGLLKPWTDDEVLRSVFFTNVYREQDRVTCWYAANVRKPLDGDPRVVFATIAFRYFNWPDTGEILLGGKVNLLWDWDTQTAINLLQPLMDQGVKVFTGAYNISNSGVSKDKVPFVCEDRIQPVWVLRHHLFDRLKGGSLAVAQEVLKDVPGLGGSGFMAAQIIADLKYSYVLKSARDWWTWCSPGPGSIRGLNLMLDRDVDAPCPKDFIGEVNKLSAELEVRFPKLPRTHAQDVQNCLCEFSKYERALVDGHVKRRYDGHP